MHVGKFKSHAVGGLIHTKRSFAMVLGVLGVLIVGLGVYSMLSNGASSSGTDKSSPVETASEIANTFSNIKQDSASVSNAQAQLNDLEKRAKEPSDKATIAQTSITLYTQVNNLDAALKKAQQANDSYGTALSAATLADIYSLKENYAQAAKYFGIAAERSPKTGPTERSAYNDYLRAKAEMEAHL